MGSPPRSPRGECTAFDFDELDELEFQGGEEEEEVQVEEEQLAVEGASWTPPDLGRSDWIDLLDSLTEAYEAKDFQEALHAHWREAEGDPVDFLRRRQELMLPVQAPIMVKFGFEPTPLGLMRCGSCFDSDLYRLFKDPVMVPKRARLQWLVDPDLQAEQPDGPPLDRHIDSFETQRKKAMHFISMSFTRTQVDDGKAALEAQGPPEPEAETEERLVARAAKRGELWRVVGGAGKGGILVREGQSVDSPASPEGRLAVGALVRALEVQGERLHFERLSGEGPAGGWVSTRVGIKDLLIKVDKDGHCKSSKNGVAPAFDESRWPAPCGQGGLRLGELLWAGRAGLERAPPCSFFPRKAYAALVLSASGAAARAGLLLLGGRDQRGCFNDVWRLALCGPASGGKWTLVSPHQEPEVDAQGRRTLNKWRPRQEFGCCTASLDRREPLVYVAGGCDEALSLMNDVWVSADGGKTWVCKTRSAPWERRAAPALASVPGRPQRLLLAGGMARFAEVCGDAWASDDAGETWTELESPAWSMKMGRYRSALFPLPSPPSGGSHECRFLLLGGCHTGHWAANDSWAGSETLLKRHLSDLNPEEKLLHDAWECHLDLFPVDKSKAATWTPWGLSCGDDSERHILARWGVMAPTAAFDAASRSLVATFGSRLSVAAACCPKGDLIQWHEADVAGDLDSVVASTKEAGMQLLCVRFLEAAGSGRPPRVAVLGSGGVLLSGDGELRRQRRFAALLGARLAGLLGLPIELWMGRVLPLLLPEGPSGESASTAPASAAPATSPVVL